MKTKESKTKITFSEIMEEVGAKNAQKLMNKACSYNYLAKTVKSKKETAIAYCWKNRCLSQLLQKCDKHSCVVYDESYCHNHKDIMLIRLRNNLYGLHSHRKWFQEN